MGNQSSSTKFFSISCLKTRGSQWTEKSQASQGGKAEAIVHSLWQTRPLQVLLGHVVGFREVTFASRMRHRHFWPLFILSRAWPQSVFLATSLTYSVRSDYYTGMRLPIHSSCFHPGLFPYQTAANVLTHCNWPSLLWTLYLQIQLLVTIYLQPLLL